MQNERICLLLILVDPESTVCPGKGRVLRTSYSKSTTYPEKAEFYGRIAQPGIKRPRVNQDQDNAQE